jgi:hypothetical protein
VSFQFGWSHAGGAGGTDVVWQAEAVAHSDADGFSIGYGTPVDVSDSGAAADTLYMTDETASVPPAGTPAGGTLVHLRIGRKASDAADTLDVDARLHSVRVSFTVEGL